MAIHPNFLNKAFDTHHHYTYSYCPYLSLFSTASIGQVPKGKRLDRIKQSPNYRDGRFQNPNFTHHSPEVGQPLPEINVTDYLDWNMVCFTLIDPLKKLNVAFQERQVSLVNRKANSIDNLAHRFGTI
jgi:hypothetical protein